jgi:hypothetical protein
MFFAHARELRCEATIAVADISAQRLQAIEHALSHAGYSDDERLLVRVDDDESAAGRQDSVHLPKRGMWIREVLEDSVGAHTVERG